VLCASIDYLVCFPQPYCFGTCDNIKVVLEIDVWFVITKERHRNYMQYLEFRGFTIKGNMCKRIFQFQSTMVVSI